MIEHLVKHALHMLGHHGRKGCGGALILVGFFLIPVIIGIPMIIIGIYLLVTED